MILTGTLVNAAAVAIGSLIGLALHKGIPQRMNTIVFQGLGLCTLIIGIQMGLKADNILIIIFSILIGGLIGEGIKLDEKVDALADWLKSRIKSKDNRFTEGLVTAFILFCIGSMTIIGSLNAGISNDQTMLYTKSTLDGFAAIALASSYGIGVLFSIIPLLLYQGSLTLLAGQLQPYITTVLIAQLTATGGLLVMGIGINLLEIKKIKLINFLPALVVVVILTFVLSALPH